MRPECETAVAFYLYPFLKKDGVKEQRDLLFYYVRDYIPGAGNIVEYVEEDEAFRPIFRKLLEDAKRGKIGTILVSEISCIDRDEKRAWDYLEQIFPILGVRVIAVASGYDSGKSGETIGLSQAVDRFADRLYRKEVSDKRKSALRSRWKAGQSTSGRPPYGYVRDDSVPGDWKVDRQAADVVRMIFDWALEGQTTVSIADFLNTQGVVTPSVYREEKRLYGGQRKVPDRECLWDSGKVRAILNRYAYTGALVQNYRQSIQPGSGITRAVPESERYIIEDAHEAIVTREEFERAQAAIRQMEKPKVKMTKGYLLKGKVRCGNCRLAMACVSQASGEMFYCSHKLNTGRASGCSPQPVPAKTVEAAVFGAIAERQQMEEKKCISTKQRKLTRQMVEKFVKVVYVYDSKRIEVELTF